MPISISIVEDVRASRECVTELLNEAGYNCVGTYATGEAALRGIPNDNPDVALIDIRLPGISGIECVAGLKKQLPQLLILMWTTYNESELIFNALQAGARGYILKNMPAQELFQAIELVHAGGAPMTMQVARKVVDYFSQTRQPATEIERLTAREQEVLTLLAKGCPVKDIAEQLGISAGTVRTYLRQIYEKLHVHSRSAAVLVSSGDSFHRNP